MSYKEKSFYCSWNFLEWRYLQAIEPLAIGHLSLCVRFEKISTSNRTRGCEMENLTYVPSEKQNLRTEELISWKWLIYRRSRLISLPMNICQESLPTLKPMNLLLGDRLDFLLFSLLAHEYSYFQWICLCLAIACISQTVIPLLFLNKLNFQQFKLVSVYLFI